MTGYSNVSGEVLGSAGISDPRAEISGIIVKVQRSREEVPLLAGLTFFFFKACFCFLLERGHCNRLNFTSRESSLHRQSQGAADRYRTRFHTFNPAVINIEFIALVILTLYKTQWSRELRTGSHKVNLLSWYFNNFSPNFFSNCVEDSKWEFKFWSSDLKG